MEDGIFPGSRSMFNEDDMEEERRLAYVAITRARKKLRLIHASQRMIFGTTTRNPKSRFIKEIDQDVVFKEDRITTVVPASAKSKSHSAMNTLSFQNQLAAKKNLRPAAPAKSVDYSTGDRVQHDKFGAGTVLSVKPMGNDALLEIAFDEIGTKKIMSNFAAMKKI
jgi:DNA helicase-2/ATP-dependent DNA helicase PcrA